MVLVFNFFITLPLSNEEGGKLSMHFHLQHKFVTARWFTSKILNHSPLHLIPFIEDCGDRQSFL